MGIHLPSTVTKKPWIIVSALVVLGLCLRIYVALTGNHIYYADELFQVLEQGFRLQHGYGIIPLEYVLHLRAYLLPLFLSQYLGLLEQFHVDTPHEYIPAVKILFIFLSITLIPSIYWIIFSFKHNKTHALLAAFTLSLWYELVYFAHRPFYEVISTYVYYFALGLVLRFRHPFFQLTSGFLLGIGIYLRPHYLPLLLIFFLIQFALTRKITRLWVYQSGGVVLGFVLSGAVDAYAMGVWFQSFVAYFSLNLGRGTSLINDPQNPVDLPQLFYFVSLMTTSALLCLFALLTPKNYRPLLLIPLTVVLSLTLINHKEYRFIFASLPILLALASISIYTLLERYSRHSLVLTIMTLSFISFLGLHRLLPGQGFQYPIPLLASDPNLHVYQSIEANPMVCGLFDATRRYELTGGYYFIGKNIPVYNLTYPPPLENPPVNLIITRSPKSLTGYQLIDSQPNLYLYASDACKLSQEDNKFLQRYP